MADSYVCSGAMMKCTMGTAPAKLKVLPTRTVDLTGQPQANISDHIQMLNIPAFGLCRSMGYPPTAAANGTPTSCIPNTPKPWENGKADYIIKGQKALLKSCTCRCMWGGTISLITDGQVGEGVQYVNKIVKESMDVPAMTLKNVKAGKLLEKVSSTSSRNAQQIERKVIELEPGKIGSWNKQLNGKLEPNTDYKVGDKFYKTDEKGRVRNVSGKLKLGKIGRNNYQQTKSVKLKNGIKGVDQGGHLIAHQFEGVGEQINYVPMLGKTLNQGQWKRMEKKWSDALKEEPPKEVEVSINVLYKPSSDRPIGFFVEYKIDGVHYRESFRNYTKTILKQGNKRFKKKSI